MIVRPQSLPEQTADWLRQRIRGGRWGSRIPGVPSLAKECGVAEKTVRQAILALEKEGVLTYAGAGRRRQVAESAGGQGKARCLRVGILLRDRLENEDEMFRWCLNKIQSDLNVRGHVCTVLAKTQTDLKYKDASAMKLIGRTSVDAWIVVAGSRGLLEWLVSRPQPVFAIGGDCANMENLALAGSYARPAHLAMARRLVDLGHRRIVFLLPKFARVDAPNSSVGCIKAELAAHGIASGSFNFPDWDESPEGLAAQLDATFRVSPPTAIFATQPVWMIGILAFLARKGLKVPEDISVVCGNGAGFLQWHTPSIARYVHDDARIARRVLQWADTVARCRKDTKHLLVPVRLEEGQSLAPAKGGCQDEAGKPL